MIRMVYNKMYSILHIFVLDNGIGFDVDAKEKEESVGLKNVRTRTELYCKNAVYRCNSKLILGYRNLSCLHMQND